MAERALDTGNGGAPALSETSSSQGNLRSLARGEGIDLIVGPDLPMAWALRTAIDKRCSDLIIKPGTKANIFVQGALQEIGGATIKNEEIIALLQHLSTSRPELVEKLNSHGAVDFAIEYVGQGRFRANAFKHSSGYGIALRLLPNEIPSMVELGLPAGLIEMVEKPRGLVLVTGPTGSGKTTTLASLCQHLASLPDRHIITIEDPIEYRLKAARSLVTQREVGTHTPSFMDGLRDALREFPKVIMIGEMRDQETIMTAVTAAETGHLVMSTLHTTSAAGTVNRIIDVFPKERRQQIQVQLAEALSGVACQALLPTADGKGRVAAFEFLRVTDPIRNIIRSGETFKIGTYMQTGAKDGQVLFDTRLFELARQGKITNAVALSVAQNRNELAAKLK